MSAHVPWEDAAGGAAAAGPARADARLGVRAHRSPPAAPYERGRALGRAHPDAVAATVAFYRRILAHDFDLGDADLARAGAALRDRLGALDRAAMAEEIEGIADGAGIERELLLAVNARTELIAGGRYACAPGGRGAYRGPLAECSTIGAEAARGADGHVLLAQNWDFHPDLLDARLLWRIDLPGGRWLCTFTEAGILAKLGLNDAGVGIALNFLATADDGGLGGLPIHLLGRALLEHARDLDGALALARKTPVTASSSYTVATPAGVAAAEITPRGTRVVAADGGLLVHTNHFLDATGVEDLATGPDGIADSPVRRGELLRLLADGAVAPADAMAALASHAHAPGSVCTHREGDEHAWIDRVQTLASVVMDVTARRMWVAGGQPCTAPFAEVDLS